MSKQNKLLEFVGDILTIGDNETWRGSLIRAGIFVATIAVILVSS